MEFELLIYVEFDFFVIYKFIFDMILETIEVSLLSLFDVIVGFVVTLSSLNVIRLPAFLFQKIYL
jgi:hypothetical protein